MTDKQENRDAMIELLTADDAIDYTYKEKKWKPPRILLWRNIILLLFLHMGAVYGLILIPSASRLTLAWNYGATDPTRLLFPCKSSLPTPSPWHFRITYNWVRDHHLHHKYVGTDTDPHNASRVLFFSHIGWILVCKHPDAIEKGQKLNLSDLKTDKVVMFQRRHYKVSVVVLCFLVPMLVPWCFWGESLVAGYFVPLRYAVVLSATWLVNSVAHMWGNRPYDCALRIPDFSFFQADCSEELSGKTRGGGIWFSINKGWCTDVTVLEKSCSPHLESFLINCKTFLFTEGVLFIHSGEGFHNYHHTFAFNYAASEFGCRINLTTAFIDLMCFLGLAKDRKRVFKRNDHCSHATNG